MPKVEDSIRQCYTIEDDRQAMDCIKKNIKESKDSCPARLVLLYEEGCAGCAESKHAYREEIKNGTVKAVSIKTPEGAKIAKQNRVSSVPALLVLDCHDTQIV